MIENREALIQEADRLGLSGLTDEQLAQFAEAKASAELWVSGIPRDLHMYEEPAHIFHAGEEAES